MKRASWSAIVLTVLTASTATAQHAWISAGYGREVPTGAMTQKDRGGQQVMIAAEVTLPHTPLALRGDLMYGETYGRSAFEVGAFKVSVSTLGLAGYIGSPVERLRLY